MRRSFLVPCLTLAVTAAHAQTAPAPPWIAAETPVTVKLLQLLKSNHERSGDRIRFETTADLLAPDRTVLIPKGTPVAGTVTRASHRGMLGKPGRLEFSIDAIQVSERVRVPLRQSLTGVRGRDNSGASIAVGVLLMPLCLLISGREIAVPAGREFTVFVDQPTALSAPGPAVALGPNLAPPVTPAPAALLAAARPDLAHLSEFHLKNGDIVTGSLATSKDGAYFVLTELGQITINRDMVEFIAPKK